MGRTVVSWLASTLHSLTCSSARRAVRKRRFEATSRSDRGFECHAVALVFQRLDGAVSDALSTPAIVKAERLFREVGRDEDIAVIGVDNALNGIGGASRNVHRR